MKVRTSIQRGANYIYVKFGEVVTAIEQVAVVKGLPMWEVERHLGSGLRKRLIVYARSLMPIQPTTACAYQALAGPSPKRLEHIGRTAQS